MREVFVGGLGAIVERVRQEVEASASEAVAGRGCFSMALPGGSVATECFPALATLPLEWSAVHFFWADERAVPPADPESNYSLAERLWFDPAQVPYASVHRMPADDPDLEAAAAAYASELLRVLGPPAILDLALLGLGPDGHVASLFPGHVLLDEARRTVAALADAPKPPPRRLTLTMPVLASARRVVVVGFGESKAAVLAEAVHDAHSRLPAAQLLRRARSSLVLADDLAGELIAGS